MRFSSLSASVLVASAAMMMAADADKGSLRARSDGNAPVAKVCDLGLIACLLEYSWWPPH